jgi:ElaB/YqjD/DUF883 family membrane-anchored ribosome-binding protein
MMDDRQSEDLKKQMAKTRSKLADKLETLEEQIIEPAATAVTETVTTVKEAVGNTAEAVQSTMKMVTDTFDLSAHVRKHPWQMMGAGVATGFLLSQFAKPKASAVQPFSASVRPEVTTLTGPDPQRNRANGVYAAVSEKPSADSQPQPRTGEGWSKLATEMQSMLIHALAPVCQGLIGAVLAEFLRPSKANPSEGAVSQSRSFVREDPPQDEREYEEWSHPDSKQEPDWGGRLRSTPR